MPPDLNASLRADDGHLVGEMAFAIIDQQEAFGRFRISARHYTPPYKKVGSTISIDKVEAGQQAKVTLSNHEVKNRVYDSFHFQLFGEDENPLSEHIIEDAAQTSMAKQLLKQMHITNGTKDNL